MNCWECDNRHCNVTAHGLGGAVGLRAIGWRVEFREGFSAPIIECPIHRTDDVPGEAAAIIAQARLLEYCDEGDEHDDYDRATGDLGRPITPSKTK